ncbi:MAG: bifunctional hydroxymethylpyrimidine kinase/phosphomethylpyrimidine kinase [Thermoplasmata archaeon]|nr:bifunctional hydroxymethylpyrimidine kinase/phosphomethylpyrimidine kinase [Thermoplasmata archaeon]
MKKALTIAGSDSGGGAGIEADLKVFSTFNVHGMAAITAVTAQNTCSISAIHAIPAEVVYKQIVSVAEDTGIDAAKTGMLMNANIVRRVASAIREYEIPLVSDPVMISKTGDKLLADSAISAFIKYIVPLADVITPNRMEAEKLAGMKIESKEDAIKAAEEISDMGARYVLIKGGHFGGKYATDILYHNGKVKEYKALRKEGCTHGIGCSFSAAITANMAKGKNVYNSVKIAKEFITMAIQYGTNIGKCHCPVNHMSYSMIPAMKWHAVESLERAINKLKKMNSFHKMIPEVGTNFAYSLPKEYAKGIGGIAAIDGRISKGMDGMIMAGSIRFGASRHLARVLLKAMEYDEEQRSVINIKFDRKIIKRAEKIFTVSSYDRREEPDEIKAKEGATLPWGVETAIKKVKKFPDMIYHEGDVGKEPMILVFGKNPEQVVKKLMKFQQ